MFGLFKKDPKKALEKERAALLEQAMKAQRNGDIHCLLRIERKGRGSVQANTIAIASQ